MYVGSRDSYLKSLPAVGPFLDRVARYRLKGFHREERNGDGNELDVVATYPIYPPWGLGTPTCLRDATANDSDKSFTVPARKIWDLRHIYAEITASATVGNRLMRISITNGTNTLWLYQASANIAATQVGAFYASMYFQDYTTTTIPTITTGAVTPNVKNAVFMPPHILAAGSVVRVYDNSAVDPAADDLTVVLHYVEYDA